MSINRWLDKEAVVYIYMCVCVCVYKKLCVCVCVYTHTYNGLLLSHRKECIWVSATETGEPRAYYIEWSKSEKNKYHILVHIYVI